MKHFLVGIAAICLLTSMSLAQTTRPVRGGARVVRLGQRIQELTTQLDLTDDQKEKINDIIQDTRQQMQNELPELRNATQEERRAKIQKLFEGLREQIGDILTPEQKEKLQELLRKRDADNPKTTDTGNSAVGPQKHHTLSMPSTHPSETAALMEHPAAAPESGQPAPEINLHWMNGDAMHLSTFKGKPVILVFGSYSTPAFRDKASALPHLAESYEGRAKFVIIYTKEAHPSDGWTVERNKRDGIEIAQPTDIAGRKAAALQAITALHLNNIPIALDSMDDAAANAYGAFPDGVVIIGKDGKIVARQHWLEPTALPAMINHALKN